MVVLDYVRHQIRLYDSGDAQAMRRECGAATFPVDMPRGFLQSYLLAGGKLMKAAFDTGANYSALRPSVLNVKVEGAAPPMRQLPAVRLNNAKRGALDTVLIEFKGPPVDIVLGTNFFEGHVTCLDGAPATIGPPWASPPPAHLLIRARFPRYRLAPRRPCRGTLQCGAAPTCVRPACGVARPPACGPPAALRAHLRAARLRRDDCALEDQPDLSHRLPAGRGMGRFGAGRAGPRDRRAPARVSEVALAADGVSPWANTQDAVRPANRWRHDEQTAILR